MTVKIVCDVPGCEFDEQWKFEVIDAGGSEKRRHICFQHYWRIFDGKVTWHDS